MLCPRRVLAMLSLGLEKSLSKRRGWSTVGAHHGHSVACVNQMRPLCVNQIGRIQPNLLGYGVAEARQGHGMVCKNWP